MIPRPARIIKFFQGTSFPELSHSVLQKWSTYIAHVYITDTKLFNDGLKSAFFNLIKRFFNPYPSMKSHILLVVMIQISDTARQISAILKK